tara:strand:+ start:665 stop:1192 length:528 start_codon:yes stop_codon:yes gene_type:complete
MHKVLPLAGLLVLGACTGGSSIYYYDYGRYSGSTAQYAARDGQMPLAVYGNPTGDTDAAFAAAVARGLDGTHVDHTVRFVPMQAPNATGYRVVTVFGSTKRESICTANPATGAAPGSNGPMAAAFCLDEEPLSFVQGQLAGMSSASDPALRTHLYAVGRGLFPLENPKKRSEFGR